MLYGEALENIDRRALERRLRLALGRLSDEHGRFVPEEAHAWAAARSLFH